MTQQLDHTVAATTASAPVAPQAPAGFAQGPASASPPAGWGPPAAQAPMPGPVPGPVSGPMPPAGWAPGVGAAPMPPRNTMSVLAIVFLFVCSPAAVICGVVARRQIARTGERGRGMATTGIVCGSISVAAGLLLAVLMVVGAASGAVTVTTTPDPAPVSAPAPSSVSAPSSAPAPSSTPGLSVSGPDIAASVTQQSGGLAENVTCGDLPARVGATTTCTATVNGKPTPLTVTATSVNGTHVEFTAKG